MPQKSSIRATQNDAWILHFLAHIPQSKRQAFVSRLNADEEVTGETSRAVLEGILDPGSASNEKISNIADRLISLSQDKLKKPQLHSAARGV